MTALETARGLSEAQRAAFLSISSDQWHRRPFRADTIGGRSRDFDRIVKCKRLGLIEHRINAGAQYRLTPLGLQVRALLKDNTNGNG